MRKASESSCSKSSSKVRPHVAVSRGSALPSRSPLGVWSARPLIGFLTVIALFGMGVYIERVLRVRRVTSSEKFEQRSSRLPNYDHVWFVHDMVFWDGRGGDLNVFGAHVWRFGANWKILCLLDSDGDGLSNGQELGDPCCLWKDFTESSDASGLFNLGGRHEYRRWNLSHPGIPNERAVDQPRNNRPLSCDGVYNKSHYAEQYNAFYFSGADGELEPVPVSLLKVGCLVIMLALAMHWVLHLGLLGDACPWLVRADESEKALPGYVSVLVCILSFLYMDATSGIIHLVLDYAPHWLPIVGDLAKGFQYHHAYPTAIVRISWYAYASHIHLLGPIVALLAILSDASRVQRLFWSWGAIFAHLFQSAHRWAHMLPEHVPGVVRIAQEYGLLIGHAEHMRHHEDLMHQFTILSGHTDWILDRSASIVPPKRYDLWLLAGIAWFALPALADVAVTRMLGCRTSQASNEEVARPKIA
eukprot:TRINITY_DN18146_c0_g1_i1.p1 TRINITY_DN18146_c0_g1~~TRINITY_DN18146_c0_g1_i1.p1  ORF type:complete len:473 (+),score=59.69 TRINITY_DN18146_c0_g1_i1:294-1712(+)